MTPETASKTLISKFSPYIVITMLYILFALFLWPVGNYPLNDDWVYAKGVLLTLEQGRYSVTGYESAWGVPQVLLGVLLCKLFGFSHSLLRCVGILSALVSAFGLLYLLLRSKLDKNIATMTALTFLFFPPVVGTSFSFMTDMMFAAFWIWALIFTYESHEEKSYIKLFLACLLIVLSILQRQFGILIPVAASGIAGIIVLQKVVQRTKPSCFDIVFGLTQLLLSSMYFIIDKFWWQTLQGNWSPPIEISIHLLSFSHNWTISVIYAGILSAPLLFVSRFKKNDFSLFSVAFLLFFIVSSLLIIFVRNELFPFFGNLISDFGFLKPGEVLIGIRPVILTPFFKLVFSLIGTAGGFLLIYAFAQTITGLCSGLKNGFNNVFAIGLGSSALFYLAVLVQFRETLFDRYLIPVFILVSPLSFIYLNIKKQFRIQTFKRLLFVTCILFVCFSYTFEYEFLDLSKARWDACQYAVSKGIPAQNIEGGYEWNYSYRKRRPAEDPAQSVQFGWWNMGTYEEPTHAIVSYSDVDIQGLPTQTISFPYKSFYSKNTKIYLKLIQGL